MLALLFAALVATLIPRMGLQSFVRLGGEARDRRVYAVYHVLRAALALDALCCALALQFHLSYWSIEGWPHDGAGTEWGTATAIGLGLSSLACVLANAAATRAPLNPLLLAAVTLGLGAAIALTVVGASQPAISDPLLTPPYLHALNAILLMLSLIHI